MTVTEPDPNAQPQADPNDPNNVTIEVPPQQEPPAPLPPPIRQARSGGDPQVFGQEDIERIRNEERARFQREVERADALDAEVTRFRQAEDERIKAEQKTQREQERAQKKKEEEQMELRDLIAKKDQEWEARLESERQEREKAFAMLEQERRHASLQTYLSQRMAIEAEEIAPELRDMVSGNSEEEIEASITLLKKKSSDILGNYTQIMRGQQATRPTVGVTQPPVGPMEMAQTTQTLTPDDIRALTPEEYSQHRDALLRAASSQRANR